MSKFDFLCMVILSRIIINLFKVKAISDFLKSFKNKS